MSAGFRCDRCGEMLEGSPSGIIAIDMRTYPKNTSGRPLPLQSGVRRDICGQCLGDIDYAWMHVVRSGA